MSESLTNSPDWPAYYCYLLVLTFGLIVAYSRVSLLFAGLPGAWGTVNIWLLLLAYTAVPLALFWFLDWTNAIHDTSLFAAILIAAGYRQILSGRMTGIQLPGATSKVWQPFEAWANWLGDRIRDRVQLNTARYTDQVIRSVKADPQKLNDLKSLALLRSANPQQVQADFDALRTTETIALWGDEGVLDKQIRSLYQSLRAVADSDLLMRKAKIIDWRQYYWYAKEWRSKARAWLVVAAALVALGVAGWRLSSPNNWARYYYWRLEKPNTTPADLFRSKQEYAKLLEAAPEGEFARIGRSLRYEGLSLETADRLLAILLENRSRSKSGIQYLLIDSLRADNPDIRTRVQNTLTYLANERAICVTASLANWKPSKNDGATQIDQRMKDWQAV